MTKELNQGDILRIEKIAQPVLIVSKNFFNQSGEIIGCPIYSSSSESPLHISVSTGEINGYVQCEKLRLLDLNVRGYTKIDSLALIDKINISDAVQSIFDYI